jgi:hypothetical protein
LNRIGKHQFIFDENEYEVVLHTLAIHPCDMECSLLKDGTCIKKFKACYEQSKPTIKPPLRYIINGGAAFLNVFFVNWIVSTFKIPLLFPLMLGTGLYLLILGQVLGRKKFAISQIDV